LTLTAPRGVAEVQRSARTDVQSGVQVINVFCGEHVPFAPAKVMEVAIAGCLPRELWSVVLEQIVGGVRFTELVDGIRNFPVEWREQGLRMWLRMQKDRVRLGRFGGTGLYSAFVREHMECERRHVCGRVHWLMHRSDGIGWISALLALAAEGQEWMVSVAGLRVSAVRKWADAGASVRNESVAGTMHTKRDVCKRHVAFCTRDGRVGAETCGR
jgi:hypothetical protein